MVLSKREQKIAIGVGGVLAALLVYSYVVEPLIAHRDEIKTKLADAKKVAHTNHDILGLQRDLKPAWNDMSTHLTSNDGEAMSQASNHILRWASGSGVTVSSIKPDRTTTENKFVVSSFHVTAGGHMASVTRFIWALESSPIPMRVHEVQLKPRKEGTDDLEVQLSVSTLSVLPGAASDADKPAAGDKAATDKQNTVSRADSPR